MTRVPLRNPAAFVALFTLCWAVIECIAPASEAAPVQVIWTRYGVHLAFMLLVFGRRHHVRLVATPNWRRQLFASLLMFGMPMSFILAMRHTPPHDALTAFWLAPLCVVAFSALARDRSHDSAWHATPWPVVWLTLLGWCGVVVVYHPDTALFRAGGVFALASGMCLAGYMLLVHSMRDESMITKLFHTALWVFVAMSFLLPSVWRTPTLLEWGVMVAVGLLGWVALYALDRALEQGSPAMLAPALYSQLVWDQLSRWVTHPAPLGLRSAFGLAVVAIAGLAPVVFWRGRYFEQTQPTPL